MPDETRERILETAMGLFARRGFAKTTMNDIVRESRLSKGGVYWYFSSKDEIVNAIFDQFFESQIAVLRAILAEQEQTATGKLIQLARLEGGDAESLLTQFPSSLEFYALAARETALLPRLQHYFSFYREAIQTLVAQGINSGEWVNANAIETADTIITMFEGTVLIWSIVPDAFRLSAQLEASVSLLLNGLNKA